MLTETWDYGKKAPVLENSKVKQKGGKCLRALTETPSRGPEQPPSLPCSGRGGRLHGKPASRGVRGRPRRRGLQTPRGRGGIRAEELMLKSWEEIK